MPILKVNQNGEWKDIASSYTHAHTVQDISDLPASLVDDVEALKDKVGANSVAFQIASVIGTNTYQHPATHPAGMITGLAKVATSGSYKDLKDKPTIPSIDGLATESYVQEEIGKIDISGASVQANWNQTDSSKPDYIQHKPTIPSVDGLATEQFVQDKIDAIQGADLTGYATEEYVQEELKKIDVSEQLEDYALKSEIPSIDGLATEQYVQTEIAKASIAGGNGGSGEGGTSVVTVQADWNQNDKTQVDFIKNKPFGEGYEYNELLPLTTYSDFSFNDYYGLFMYQTASSYSLSIGESYAVSWDGVEYTCVAQDGSVFMDGTVAIGNLSMLGLQGNNEPFIIGVTPDGFVIYVPLTDTEAGIEHSVRIVKEGIVVKHIDDKYLSIMKYVEPTLKDFLPLTKYTNFALDSGYGLYYTASFIDYSLSIGQSYTVFWDGIEYTCTAQDISSLMSGAVAVGNLSAFGLQGNNEPFVIAVLDGGANYFSLTDTEAGGEHSVRISQAVEGYYDIKEKYAPQSDWNENDNFNKAYIKNKPFGTFAAGTIVYPETTVNCSVAMEDGAYATLLSKPNIELGKFAYNIELDGNTYSFNSDDVYQETSVFQIYYSDKTTGTILIFSFYNGMYMLISSQGEHTFKMTLAEDAIRKIDSKYIPEIEALPEVTTNDNGKILVVSNGAWTVQKPASGLPDVTIDDAGKFLRVSSNGVWAVETILNAEEVGF